MSANLSYGRMIAMYGLWWSMWILIGAHVLHGLGLSFRLAAGDSVVTNLLLALTGFGMYNVFRFYQPGKGSYFYLRLWVLLVAVFSTMLLNWLLGRMYAVSPDYLTFLEKGTHVRFCYVFLMISFISLFNWMVYNFRNEQENAQRKTDAEALAREAELTSLRQQLQPHFLFNSLNSISALAGSRPEEARRMIQQLSDFLRGTMKKDNQHMVSLGEEMQHLQLYLDIEKVRFGHRLSTRIELDEKSLNLQLPPLLLQPVVENAIKFGLYDTTDEIVIGIHSATEGSDLLVTVENPFDPLTALPGKGTGFGLSSVQRRLYLLYARNDLLHTHAAGNTFTTTIRIPQQP